MNIGQRIRERRLELNMTQEELAKAMNYKSKSTINKIELGINDIPLSKVVEFADVLKTSPSYLMGWDGEDGGSKNIQFEGYDFHLFGNNEKELLDIYDQLSTDGQQKLIEYAQDLKASKRYEK